MLLNFIAAVFPAIEQDAAYSDPSITSLAILGLLLALLSFVVPLVFKFFRYCKKQIVKEADDQHWKQICEEKMEEQSKRIHWLEIMMITMVELQVSGETSREKAMTLLEQFKRKYPNPKSFDISVCEEYIYEFIEAVKHGRNI